MSPETARAVWSSSAVSGDCMAMEMPGALNFDALPT